AASIRSRSSCSRWSATCARPSGSPAEPAGYIPQMQVLVADADEDRRERLARLLRAAGHDVGEAASAEEVLDRCCGGAQDVVLIDSALRPMDNGDLVAALKGDPVAFSTAVVLIEPEGLASAA